MQINSVTYLLTDKYSDANDNLSLYNNYGIRDADCYRVNIQCVTVQLNDRFMSYYYDNLSSTHYNFITNIDKLLFPYDHTMDLYSDYF